MNITNINVTYENNLVLLIDELNIIDGEKVCIIGKSGSGKSTFLKYLFGLINDLDNTSNISYLPQNSDLIDVLTVKTNIEMIKFNSRNIFKNFITIHKKNEEIYDVVNKLDISDKLNTPVNKLSGGEIQRVLIARSLYENKDIYLFDEPTSALDSINSNNVMQLITQRLNNKTIICIIHDLSLVTYFDRLLVFSNGKIVKDAKVNKLDITKLSEYIDE